MCFHHYDVFCKNYHKKHNQCCDPLQIHQEAKLNPFPRQKLKAATKHDEITLALRDTVKAAVLHLFSKMVPGQKICVSCKVKVYEKTKAQKDLEDKLLLESTPSVQSSQQTMQPQQSMTPPSNRNINQDPLFEFQDIGQLNQWLTANGSTPIDLRKLKTRKSCGKKVVEKIKAALKKLGHIELEDRDLVSFREMIAQLQKLELYFDSEEIDSITSNEWEQPDRGNVVTVTLQVDYFTSKFIPQN